MGKKNRESPSSSSSSSSSSAAKGTPGSTSAGGSGTAAPPPLLVGAGPPLGEVVRLPEGSLAADAVTNARGDKRLSWSNIVSVVGGIMATVTTPYSVYGTILFAFGVVPVLLQWGSQTVWAHAVRRRCAGLAPFGVTPQAKALGYNYTGLLISLAFYLGFWLAALITFSSVAEKKWTDNEGTKLTGLIFALITWACLFGTMRASLITLRSGALTTRECVVVPEMTMSWANGDARHENAAIGVPFADIERLVAGRSIEHFRTVASYSKTSGNTKTTTTVTRSWTRDVLHIGLVVRGRADILFLPVSGSYDVSNCKQQCCLPLVRTAEVGILARHAVKICDAIIAARPDLSNAGDSLRALARASENTCMDHSRPAHA